SSVGLAQPSPCAKPGQLPARWARPGQRPARWVRAGQRPARWVRAGAGRAASGRCRLRRVRLARHVARIAGVVPSEVSEQAAGPVRAASGRGRLRRVRLARHVARIAGVAPSELCEHGTDRALRVWRRPNSAKRWPQLRITTTSQTSMGAGTTTAPGRPRARAGHGPGPAGEGTAGAPPALRVTEPGAEAHRARRGSPAGRERKPTESGAEAQQVLHGQLLQAHEAVVALTGRVGVEVLEGGAVRQEILEALARGEGRLGKLVDTGVLHGLLDLGILTEGHRPLLEHQ